MMTAPEESLEDLLQAFGTEEQLVRRSEALGISKSALRRLRAGAGHAVEFRTIHALAELLNVDVDRVDRAVSVRRRGAAPRF
ncbi:MAG: hypothetical protein JNN13_10425 [Planctomycetes bacterium]|nr:hypothetical protein [Planctomycetota bacterium]